MTTKILVIEDNADINHMIAQALTKNGYSCDQAYSGTEGLLRFEQTKYDLILLDLMLPGLDGESVLSKFRKISDLPILVLTAKDSIESKVEVLRAGADDYLCKPFAMEELLVRIQVQLRKINKTKPHDAFKQLTLDPTLYDARINGELLQLTKHEYYILELLIGSPHRVFTKQEIYEYAWNEPYYGDDKTINVHISNLRKKIHKYVEEEYIKTVWGIGFKMAE